MIYPINDLTYKYDFKYSLFSHTERKVSEHLSLASENI